MTQQYQSRSPSNSLLRRLFQCQGILALHVSADNLGQLVCGGDDQIPSVHRYIVDNMFTSAAAEDLLPGIRKIIETLPPHPSHFVFAGWKPSADRADMVYGLEDEIYLALYTAWRDPADDQRYCDWAQLNMTAMSHLATGISLADENLARRPAKFITDPNMARLNTVRAAYDPDGLFHSWMARG